MTREVGKLSARRVATLNKPGRYGDGAGLWLQVTDSGVKSWLFRFMVDGKAYGMGLGPAHTFTLAEARERARLARQQLANGVNPLETKRADAAARKAVAQEAAGAKTFAQCAEAYVKSREGQWRSAVHRAQWRATLGLDPEPGAKRKTKRGRKPRCPSVLATIGQTPVAAVTTDHVMRCLQPLWDAGLQETCLRTRGRIERVLDWARVRGFRSGDNPARWDGNISELLGQRKKPQHQPAMHYSDLPAFMAELRERDGTSARALELTILSATRTAETIGTMREEIDIGAAVWRIPAERTKSGRPHDVPLSSRAVTILDELPRHVGNPYVFPGAREGKPLSNMAMLELLRDMRPGLTVHGFRSTFRDWCGDQTEYPREIAEAALAHVLKDKTEAAYRRSTAFERRRKLMQDWADYCGKIVPIAQLKAAAAG